MIHFLPGSASGGGGGVDVTDRLTRQLGRVVLVDQFNNPLTTSAGPTLEVDVTNRAGRSLGVVSIAPTPLTVDISNPLPLPVSITPFFTTVYSFALIDAPGVAAANRFLSLFNTAGSGVEVWLIAAIVETYSIAASITRNSLRLTRVTTATVGTLQAAAAINKYVTGSPNAAAAVRTANPTVTLAAEVTGFGPNASMTVAGSTAIARREFAPNHLQAAMQLVEGEGVTLHQTIAGDTDQTHNLTIVWAEVP